MENSAAKEDTAPKAPDGGGEENNTITIRVRDQTGEETFFKVKKTTRMEKVFTTYASRKGVQVNALRFLLDGERVNPAHTPKMLDLEDQDQIDCMLEQQGGAAKRIW
uniref:Ubiquitin-like domain-containing protein n=1 Tax=Fibrocapsa japonica TaxID=94617 RepID=A0A7S2UU84_9STRA|mmetsp:Transcript_10285/g.15488  ORF Transcript_10285/g.15488 Transcript_10285/m.15488 type:complete len:107 (+) Transcript_10285:89-409(+)